MGKNRTQMRGDLRLDLKDAATTWSNAELDRCIERAVGDLSRFLPDERMYEESLQFTVTGETVTFPLDAVSGKVVATESLADGVAAGDFATIDGQPDVPRHLRMLVIDANDSLTLLTIIASGIDENDDAISETFHYGKGGDKVFMGKKYFKAVYSVEIDQIGGAASGDSFELGIGAYTDVWVSLDNKPIKRDSETVTSHTRDTDYVMDYANGRIKAIAGGDISAGDEDTIGYTKSKISLDLSSLPGYVRTHDVEYPCGEVPQESPSYEMFGNIVTVTSRQDTSQSEMYEDKHIAVRYYARHDAPTEAAPGTYPSFLDNTVELAASAYALFMIATKYEHQVATDISGVAAKITLAEGSLTSAGSSLTSAGTELGLTGAIHTLAAAAFAKVTTHIGVDTADSETETFQQLDFALDESVLAAAALVKVTTYLENNTNEDSKFWLTKITTDIAGLRTATLAAVDGAAAHLANLNTETTGDFALAEAVWTEEVKHILTAVGIPNAEDLLELGDDKIDLVNVGSDVAEVYRRYAESALNMAEKWADKRRDFLTGMARRIDAAMAFSTEASQRLSNLRSYIEQAEGWGRIATGFVEEAVQRVANARTYLENAAQRINICRTFIEEGMGLLSEIRTHIEEADIFQRIAATHREAAIAHQNDAAILQASATTHGELAEKFREEAIERRNEAWAIWRDPKQYIGQFSISSRRQAYSSTT